VDAALCLGGAVFVDEVLEATGTLAAIREPDLVVDLLGGVHISKRGKADIVERVVGHIVLAEVGPAVLEAPEGQGVELLALPNRKSSALGTCIAWQRQFKVDIRVRDILVSA
jgi:hypothetical protein